MKPSFLVFLGMTYLFVLCFLSIDVGIIKVFSVILSNLVSGYVGFIVRDSARKNNNNNIEK